MDVVIRHSTCFCSVFDEALFSDSFYVIQPFFALFFKKVLIYGVVLFILPLLFCFR